MITSVTIVRLRGIEHAKLAGLHSLNILVGPNGCGKSTLLDAVLLGAGESEQSAFETVVQRHVGLASATRWLLWRGDGAAYQQSTIHLDFGNRRETHVHFLASKVAGVIDIIGIERDQGLYTEKPRAVLVDTRPQANEIALHELYSRAVEHGRERECHDLARVLLPRASHLTILSERNKPVLHVVLQGNDGSIPAQLVGDGLHGVLRLALELAAHSGSIALLEEPEAHKHPAAIALTAKLIWAAVVQGVQVILTTHSLELIDHLLLAAPAQHLDQLQVFRMRLDRGQLHAVAVPGVDVKRLRTDIEEDLR